MNIEAEFKRIIASYLDVIMGDITEQTSLVGDLDATDADLNSIADEAEDEFDVDLPPDCSELATVGDWIRAITQQLE